MSAEIIRWGILGTSSISEVMAAAIQDSASSQLVGVASRSLATAQSFAEKFAIPHAYQGYDALLASPNIDAIYIGLPNHLHKEWIIRCAQAHKHILCEKPFVTSIEEAQEVFTAIAKANVFCMEALMYRCHPFTKKLQELIQDKVIGEIKLFKTIYTANIANIANPKAGGSIRNLGCYPISLVRLLANSEPVEMVSLGRLSDKTGNDSQASTILRFENQMIAVVSTADDIDMFWQFDVYGTEGHLKVKTNPWLPGLQDNKVLIYREGKTTPLEISVVADKPLYTYQIDKVNHWISTEHFSGENYDGVSWQHSLGNIAVLEKWLKQIKESVSTNQPYA
jgi:predicted dehydrogenase